MSPSPEVSRIRRPSTDAEWDTFLEKYAHGEFFHCNFVDKIGSDAPSSEDPPSELLLDVCSTRVPTPQSLQPSQTPTTASASTVTITDQSAATVRPSKMQHARSLFADSIDEQGTSTPPVTDYHPDTSTSGPSNQDPGIPNIDNVADQNRGAAREDGTRDSLELSKVEESSLLSPIPSPLKPADPTVASRSSFATNPARPALARKESSQGRPPVLPKNPSMNPRQAATPATMGQPIPLPESPASGRHETVGVDKEASDTSASVAGSAGAPDAAPFDPVAERTRIKEFFKQHGYMPAPTQPPDATRRRLKALRRLGLDSKGVGEDIHRATLDRFTRLACSVFNTKMSVVTIVGNDRQLFPSERGLDLRTLELDVGLCCHTVMSTDGQCLVVDNAAEDWRFRANPFVAEGSGPIQFYAGAPLVLGQGKKQATIGTLCIIDDKPRYDFGDYGRAVLTDLAACVVSELELLYQEQASKWIARMHQTSVDFQRRALQVRAPKRPTRKHNQPSSKGSNMSSENRSEADTPTASDGSNVNMYDEACREIRNTLEAYAVAVVDLSQFHMFYPAYAGSSTGTGTTSNMGSSTTGDNSSRWHSSGQGSRQSTNSMGSWSADSESMPYAKPEDLSRARPTYHVNDQHAPQGRLPQVVFVPSRRSADSKGKQRKDDADDHDNVGLEVLGYSCAHDGFVFNFLSSPASRKIVSEFIALNVRSRKVWYARDDSENVAASITHLMPPGTETSLAMPIYDFDGQVAFAIVACWTDPLFSYPSGSMAFVESIAGTLLASVMKEKLHMIERSQMMFATAASHETRTPLHQLLASAASLRLALGAAAYSPGNSPASEDPPRGETPVVKEAADSSINADTRAEIAHQLDVIEANGMALSSILENIVDTLDVGRLAPKKSRNAGPGGDEEVLTEMVSLSDMLEEIVNEVMATNEKLRKLSSGTSTNVEAILEVLPRARGGWLMGRDDGPLRRALTKIIDNAFKFTQTGFVHITVQDVSREASIGGGMDNSMSMSTIAINVRDSGCGMTAEFLESNLLQPFAKADPFSSGSGLGLGLAQRLIQLLDGKIALQSTIGSGTTVQVEVPLRLMNRDHDSDIDNVEFNSEGEWEGDLPTTVRKDKIYLAGFNEASNASTRRLGKSLQRQLQRFEASLTKDIAEARLVVATAEVEDSGALKDLVQSCSPEVQVIVLCQTPGIGKRPQGVRRKTGEESGPTIEIKGRTNPAVRRLPRFLSPSVVREIVRPLSPSPPSSPRSPLSPVKRPLLATVPMGESSQASSATVVPHATARQGIIAPTPAPTNERPILHHVDASDPLPMQPGAARRPAMTRAISELAAAHEARGSDAASPPPTLRVLVVEDNAINRKILTGMLRKMGVHFGEAVDGVDAVEKFLTFRPGVVLLDINMPRKDGFETASEMRNLERSHRWKRSTIVAVTAMSSELLKRRGIFECGIDAWRTKPVSIKDLKKDVETLLGGGVIS